MSDHCEEQEMEAEALAAIFEDAAEVVSSTQPFQWAVTLYPEAHNDEDDDAPKNHVGIRLHATIPLDYPEFSTPTFRIELIKGLNEEEHQPELIALADEEAQANLGLPSIYAVCERLREWLVEHNVKGMDDVSMYAQMMRREQAAKKEEAKAQQAFESAKEVNEMTEAEAEELAVRKRRAEGTPCTLETFEAWITRFNLEQERLAEEAAEEAAAQDGKKKKAGGTGVDKKANRITGEAFFSDKSGTFNLADLERAAEEAGNREDDESEGDALENVEDEDLFDDDDDLDDLDFDDSDDDDDDDGPDI